MDVRGNPSTKMARGAKLSLSRAIHLVFGVGLMAAAMGAAAQSCPGGSCPPINVYGGPISWGGGWGGVAAAVGTAVGTPRITPIREATSSLRLLVATGSATTRGLMDAHRPQDR